jgi:hypothetical protein
MERTRREELEKAWPAPQAIWDGLGTMGYLLTRAATLAVASPKGSPVHRMKWALPPFWGCLFLNTEAQK